MQTLVYKNTPNEIGMTHRKKCKYIKKEINKHRHEIKQRIRRIVIVALFINIGQFQIESSYYYTGKLNSICKRDKF